MICVDGVWLIDSEGNCVLDGMVGFWCMNVGYGWDSFVDVVVC